jgi:hypothetical protein
MDILVNPLKGKTFWELSTVSEKKPFFQKKSEKVIYLITVLNSQKVLPFKGFTKISIFFLI